jgi:hypothetical protein
MRILSITISAVALTVAGSANAETGKMLNEAECNSLWSKANPQMSDKVPESAMTNYLTDVKAVNPDGDGTIEMAEFKKACADGMIKSAAGAAPASGSAPQKAQPGETSDRTPEKKTETPAEQKDAVDGETSDRTPGKK